MTTPIYLKVHDRRSAIGKATLVNVAHIVAVEPTAYGGCDACRIILVGSLEIITEERCSQIDKALLDAGVTVKTVE